MKRRNRRRRRTVGRIKRGDGKDGGPVWPIGLGHMSGDSVPSDLCVLTPNWEHVQTASNGKDPR